MFKLTGIVFTSIALLTQVDRRFSHPS